MRKYYMKTKILSIIIPHFNSVSLLKKLLISIPKQENIEVIVIDDQSTEDAQEFNILKKEKDFEHITFLSNDTDKKGAGTCRNIGMNYAQGEWLLFADADDYFTENFYESISQYFESDNEVVFFRTTSIYIDTGEIADRHEQFCTRLDNYLERRDLKSELELRYKLHGPVSKMIKKSFVVAHQICFEEVLASNDVLFSSRVGFYMNRFHVSTECIYVITRNFDSLTSDMSEKIYDIRLHEKIKYYSFLKMKLSHDNLRLLNISFLDFMLRSSRYGLGKYLKVWKLIRKSNVPLWDRRFLNFKEFYKLVYTKIHGSIKNKKYFR